MRLIIYILTSGFCAFCNYHDEWNVNSGSEDAIRNSIQVTKYCYSLFWTESMFFA